MKRTWTLVMAAMALALSACSTCRPNPCQQPVPCETRNCPPWPNYAPACGTAQALLQDIVQVASLYPGNANWQLVLAEANACMTCTPCPHGAPILHAHHELDLAWSQVFRAHYYADPAQPGLHNAAACLTELEHPDHNSPGPTVR